MFEIKFPRDVRKYKEKIFASMTWKQIACVIVGAVIAVPSYVIGIKYVPEDIISWVSLIEMGIFIGIGWGNIDGFPLDKYLKYFYAANYKKPRKRYYQRESLDAILLEEEYENIKSELQKVIKQLEKINKKK